MSSSVVAWGQGIQSDSRITVKGIEHFNARGMRCVYGRGDRFGRKATLNLDLWKNREGRLLARFSSRGSEVDWESWEVIGLEDPDFPFADERWVPQCLRQCYEAWVLSN